MPMKQSYTLKEMRPSKQTILFIKQLAYSYCALNNKQAQHPVYYN